MNTFLKGLGLAFLSLLLLAGVGIGIMVHKGHALDAESERFAARAIPAITGVWDKQALLDRASPELIKVATPDQLAPLFERFARLGALVACDTPKGQSIMSYTPAGEAETASYVAKAKFANGEATLRLVLVKRDGRWMINGFRVDPTLTRDVARA